MHSRTNWPFVALLALLSATPAQAQTPADGAVNKQVREGFWLEMDVGYAAFGCEGCGPRSNEVGLGFSIGGAVGDKWLIGLLSSGSVSNLGKDSEERDAGVMGLGAHYYPTPFSGFHWRGIVGVSYVSHGSGDPEYGSIGGFLGVGYDTPRTGSFGFTPYAGVVAGSIDGETFNSLQIGVGLSWH